MGRQLYQHLAMVLMPVPPRHRSLLREPVHQFHRAVMAKTELLGKRMNRRTRPGRQSLDRQQKLMLLWLYPSGTRSIFGEMQELPDSMPEFRKPAKPNLRDIRVQLAAAEVLLALIHLRRPAC